MSKKLKHYLSEKDESVDKGYIGIYSLFSDIKYALPTVKKEQWCIGKKRLQEMRFNSYKEAMKRFKLIQAEDFSSFWNGNIDVLNDLRINQFAELNTFKELATIMVCFVKTVPTASNNYKKLVSFGINENKYREYYKAQLEYINTGVMPKVRIHDRKKNNLPQSIVKYKKKVITMGDSKIKLETNALYHQFNEWCKIKGISNRKGVEQALKLLIETYPVTEVGDIKMYERKCDVTLSEIIIPNSKYDEKIRLTPNISKTIYTKMVEIIRRFNLDIENIGKKDMTIASYVSQAINELNNKVPLKYSSPEAYIEYMEIKEAERYNKENSL